MVVEAVMQVEAVVPGAEEHAQAVVVEVAIVAVEVVVLSPAAEDSSRTGIARPHIVVPIRAGSPVPQRAGHPQGGRVVTSTATPVTFVRGRLSVALELRATQRLERQCRVRQGRAIRRSARRGPVTQCQATPVQAQAPTQHSAQPIMSMAGPAQRHSAHPLLKRASAISPSWATQSISITERSTSAITDIAPPITGTPVITATGMEIEASALAWELDSVRAWDMVSAMVATADIAPVGAWAMDTDTVADTVEVMGAMVDLATAATAIGHSVGDWEAGD